MTTINLGTIGGTGPDFSHRHARTTDPGTSKVAAGNAKQFARGHFLKILQGLAYGAQTAQELYSTTGLTVVQILRRTADLERASAIKATGQVRNGCREFILFAPSGHTQTLPQFKHDL